MDTMDRTVNHSIVTAHRLIQQMCVPTMDHAQHPILVLVTPVTTVYNANHGLVTGLYSTNHPCVHPTEHVSPLTLVNARTDTLVTNAHNGTVSGINVVVTERVTHLISVGVIKGTTRKTAPCITVME